MGLGEPLCFPARGRRVSFSDRNEVRFGFCARNGLCLGTVQYRSDALGQAWQLRSRDTLHDSNAHVAGHDRRNRSGSSWWISSVEAILGNRHYLAGVSLCDFVSPDSTGRPANFFHARNFVGQPEISIRVGGAMWPNLFGGLKHVLKVHSCRRTRIVTRDDCDRLVFTFGDRQLEPMPVRIPGRLVDFNLAGANLRISSQFHALIDSVFAERERRQSRIIWPRRSA